MRSLELKQGNNVINLGELGFFLTLPLKISTPELVTEFNRIDGMAGRVLSHASHEKVVIEAEIEFNFSFEAQYPMLRDRIQSIVSGTEPFYIREIVPEHIEVKPELPGETQGPMKLPTMRYADGKQYLVIGAGSTSFEQVSLTGTGTVTFETARLPYAESIGTSMIINNNGVMTTDNLWSMGMGLLMQEKNKETWIYKYSNVPTFNIFNPGHVPINDYKQYCKIKLTARQSASSIRLTDRYGRTFVITRTINSGDVIVINQPYVTVNDATAIQDTNYVFPYIDSGYNTFKIEGISAYDIEFDFRFYYGAQNIRSVRR